MTTLWAGVAIYLLMGVCHIFPGMRFIRRGEQLPSILYLIFCWPDLLLRRSNSWFWQRRR